MPMRGAAAMTRRADSAPARWPAERGKPREVAQRPLPSEMIATWSRGAGVMAGCAVGIGRTVRCCMSMFFLRRGGSLVNYSVIQSEKTKKFWRLAFARRANQRFHMIQVALQCPTPRCRQAIFRLRQAPVERFRAHDVLGLFQLASVNAQVAVGGFQQRFELVESQRAVNRQRADDTQADAF